MCVKNAADNYLSYQGVLIKWAKMLETSSVFSSTVLGIFTMKPGPRFVSQIFSMSSKYFLEDIITGTDR